MESIAADNDGTRQPEAGLEEINNGDRKEAASVDEKEPVSQFRKWAPLLVLSLSLAIILIDVTLLNVALATIIRELNTSIQKIQWVITAYSLTIAAFMITGGRLGDLFGRKKMFVLGAVIFAVGSYVCSISHNVPTMIIGESVIEGIGAALMLPATMSLLMSTYRGRDRSVAFGIWGGVAGAATAIGPLLGGWITTSYSWRWAFRINVVVAAFVVGGAFLIKEYRDREEKPKLDWIGVILSSSGLFFLVYGIIESSTYGWARAIQPFSIFNWVTFGKISVSLYAIVIGVLILAGFVLWERRMERGADTPLVSPRLFKNRQFVSGANITGIVAMGQAGLIFSLPVFLQAVRGFDAFHTGLALVPLSAAALIAAPLAGVLANRIGSKLIVQAGLVLLLAGYMSQVWFWNVNSTAADFIPSLIMIGMGIGAMMGQIGNLTLSAVSVQQAGEASGVNNTFRQVGATLGTAIIGAVIIASIASSMISGVNASRVIPNAYKSQVSRAVKDEVSNVEFGGGAQLPAFIPKNIKDEIVKISHESVTKANRTAILLAAAFTFLGLLASFLLPGKHDQIQEGEDLAPHLVARQK